jgi:hydrogenase expression/formation protein HypD
MTLSPSFRDPHLTKSLAREIQKTVTHPWVIMEICGGQTHAMMQYGIDQLLPDYVELVHGPGCPVCVTPLEKIDRAIAIAAQPDVIFTSYGDMLRVPGSQQDLFAIRGDVRVVYSPLDAVRIAQQNPTKQVVFFAIGFETTAPANAMSIIQADALKLENFSVLVSQVCVPPAMHAILSSPNQRVQGFLAAGHVCAVMGYWQYPPIACQYHVPIVVTGFEPVDLMTGLLYVLRQLEMGTDQVQNAYTRIVTREGNPHAQQIINRVFEPCDQNWRGIGNIPQSGLALRHEYKHLDAEERFNVKIIKSAESEVCISGLILQGLKKPLECPAFGLECTPSNPLGATMVSSEGTCAAYYRYSQSRIVGDK